MGQLMFDASLLFDVVGFTSSSTKLYVEFTMATNFEARLIMPRSHAALWRVNINEKEATLGLFLLFSSVKYAKSLTKGPVSRMISNTNAKLHLFTCNRGYD